SMAASICSSADARPFCQGARNPRALLSRSTARDDQRAGRDRQDRHHRAQVREAEVRDLDQSVKDEPDTQEELTEVLLHEGTAFRKSEGDRERRQPGRRRASRHMKRLSTPMIPARATTAK